jgi:hypothetical protein
MTTDFDNELVLCVEDDWEDGANLPVNYPLKDGVYTIREAFEEDGIHLLALHEFCDTAWAAECFCPIQKKPDISIFKQMERPNTKKKKAVVHNIIKKLVCSQN